jgi:hypothetical protein
MQKKTLERPRRRWKDNIKVNFQTSRKRTSSGFKRSVLHRFSQSVH